MGASGDEYSQYNVRGLADKTRRKPKLDKIDSLLDIASSVKMLNIQETHLTSIEDEPPSFKKFKHILPTEVNQIIKLSKYVRLKTQSLSVIVGKP